MIRGKQNQKSPIAPTMTWVRDMRCALNQKVVKANHLGGRWKRSRLSKPFGEASLCESLSSLDREIVKCIFESKEESGGKDTLGKLGSKA